MRNVYLLLTRTQTALARVIHALTGDSYTHAALAFDENLQTLCSFARRYPRLPLPAGLVREALDGGYYENHRYISCALYALPVTEGEWQNVRRRAEEMLARRHAYRYSVRGLIMCRLGVAESRPGKYFCSQFVGELIRDSGAIRLPKPPELMRPQDLAKLPGVSCLYKGRLSGLMHDPQRLIRRASFGAPVRISQGFRD